MVGFSWKIATAGTLTAAFLISASQYVGQGADNVPILPEKSPEKLPSTVQAEETVVVEPVAIKEVPVSEDSPIYVDTLSIKERIETGPIVVAVDPPLNLSFDKGDLFPLENGCNEDSLFSMKKACLKDDDLYLVHSENLFERSISGEGKVASGRVDFFDCRDIRFPEFDGGEKETSNDASWRCLGSFNLVGGDSWRIDMSTAVKQDWGHEESSGRLGVCPEGYINCVGTGVSLEIDF